MAIVGYRSYVVVEDDAHVHHIHARRQRPHVGAFSPNTQFIVPVLTMASVGGVFAGVLWGLRGILIGSTLGAVFGLAAVHSGDAAASEAEKKP